MISIINLLIVITSNDTSNNSNLRRQLKGLCSKRQIRFGSFQVFLGFTRTSLLAAWNFQGGINSRRQAGYTRTFFSNSEWGSTQNVLMIVLHWRKQISRSCTYLLPNTRSTHTVKIFFSLMTVYRFGVDPQ